MALSLVCRMEGMDPALKLLRDKLNAAEKKASDLYAVFAQAKREVEEKGLDLTKSEVFDPLQSKSKAYHEASKEAGELKDSYMAALEKESPLGGGGGNGGGTKDGRMPDNLSKAIIDRFGEKAFDVTSGGTITSPVFDESLLALPQRRLLVRALIPTKQIESDKFDYLRSTVYTNNAAETAAGSVKPTSVISAERIEDTVRTVAHLSEPMDRSLLRDLETMKSFIDSQLRLGLLLREDGQILNGNGTPPNLRGILNTSGILTQARGADPHPDAIFKGIMKMRNQTNPYEPSGIVLHPTDYQTIRLSKDSAGQYLLGGLPADDEDTLFGKQIAVTSAIAQGTALVGDFQMAKVYVRENALVEWFASGGLGAAGVEIASRNQLVARAEEAIGLAVARPAAFCTVTGL